MLLVRGNPSRVKPTIASVDAMRGCRSVCTITSLLIERELPVHIPIDCVPAVSGVERLCVVRSQTKIVDVLRESIDVVVLLRNISLA
jgi:hypothetical protein